MLGPAVFGEGEYLELASGLDLIGDADVGAAKTIDGLFGIADEKQLSRRQRQGWPRVLLNVGVGVAGQVEGDFGLQGVGVLKFVDEDVGILALEVSPRAVIEQQIASPHQQVVKGAYAVALAFRLEGENKMTAQFLQEFDQVRRTGCNLKCLTDLAKISPDLRGRHRPVSRCPGTAARNNWRTFFQRLRHGIGVVAGGGCRIERGDCVVDLCPEQIGRVAAPGSQCPQFLRGVRRQRRQVDAFDAAVAAEVMVAVAEDAGEIPPPSQADPGSDQGAEDVVQVGGNAGVRPEGPFQPTLPGFVEALGRGQIVQLQPAWGKADVRGPFAEQLSGEAVDGLDGCLVYILDSGFDPRPFICRHRTEDIVGITGVVVSEELFHSGTDAVGQFGGSGFGEGDGHQLVHGCAAVRGAGFDQGYDPGDQGIGFSGTGAGLHQEIGIQVVSNLLLGGPVCAGSGLIVRGGHGSTSCADESKRPRRRPGR